MGRIYPFLLMSLALLAWPGELQAQEITGIKVGDRVRVTVMEGAEYNHNQIGYLSGDGGLEPRVIIGTVSQRTEALITITGSEGRDFWEVPSSSIEELELGSRTRTFGRALPISMGILGGIGGVLSAMTWEECTGFCILTPDSRAESFAWGLVAGAVVGIPVGLLWGLTTKDVWQDVGEGRLTGTPAPFLFLPKAGGIGLGAVIPVGR